MGISNEVFSANIVSNDAMSIVGFDEDSFVDIIQSDYKLRIDELYVFFV